MVSGEDELLLEAAGKINRAALDGIPGCSFAQTVHDTHPPRGPDDDARVLFSTAAHVGDAVITARVGVFFRDRKGLENGLAGLPEATLAALSEHRGPARCVASGRRLAVCVGCCQSARRGNGEGEPR